MPLTQVEHAIVVSVAVVRRQQFDLGEDRIAVVAAGGQYPCGRETIFEHGGACAGELNQ